MSSECEYDKVIQSTIMWQWKLVNKSDTHEDQLFLETQLNFKNQKQVAKECVLHYIVYIMIKFPKNTKILLAVKVYEIYLCAKV